MTTADDLSAIARQESELIFKSFDETAAWHLGSRLRDLAIQRGYPLVIDVRRFGQQLFYCALPGAVPDQAEWVRRKVNVVTRFHRSSYAIGRELAAVNSSLEEKQGLPTIDFATHGGCFPIRVTGAGVIGCVTVSGLPQRADHELVIEAICLGRVIEFLAAALHEKIVVVEAEFAGCGGSTVKNDNEGGRDFLRNPKGRGQFSPSLRHSSLRYAPYPSLLTPRYGENWLPALPVGNSMTRPKTRQKP